MTTVTIRNVPDDVRDRLAARAARAGQSLQEHLLSELVRLSEKPTLADWAQSAADDVARRGVALDPATVAADLDADRSR